MLAGCLLSAVPDYLPALFVGRALQGVGLALAPVIITVARDAWTGDQRNRRMSLLSVAGVASASVGYPLSGLLARHAGVGGTYLAGAALVLASTGLAARFLPEHAAGDAQTVDLPSVVTLAGGLCAGLLAVTQGVTWGWSSPAVIALAVASAALFTAWLRRTVGLTARGSQPLVDLTVARHPGVAPAHGVAFSLAVGTYGLMTLAVLVVSTSDTRGWGLGLGAATAGLVILPYAFGSVLGSRIALRVARYDERDLFLPIGSVLFGVAMAVLAVGHRSLTAGLAAMALGGLASGLVFSSTPALIMSHVTEAEASSAMSFNQLVRNAGFAVGSAASVTLLAAFGSNGTALSATAGTFATLSVAVGAVAWRWSRPAKDGDR